MLLFINAESVKRYIYKWFSKDSSKLSISVLQVNLTLALQAYKANHSLQENIYEIARLKINGSKIPFKSHPTLLLSKVKDSHNRKAFNHR